MYVICLILILIGAPLDLVQMSIMAWYPLPQSGGTPSLPGDEFFDDQLSAGWPLWSFGSSADDDPGSHGAGGARAEKHGNGDAAGSSDEHTEGPVLVPQQRTQPTDDIFMYVSVLAPRHATFGVEISAVAVSVLAVRNFLTLAVDDPDPDPL